MFLQSQLEEPACSAVPAGSQGGSAPEHGEDVGPDLLPTKPLRMVAMVLAGESPSPKGIARQLEASLQTPAFTSCESGRSRFSSCAEAGQESPFICLFL